MPRLTEIQKIARARNKLLQERELIKEQRKALRTEIKVSSNKELLTKMFKEAGKIAKLSPTPKSSVKEFSNVGIYNYGDLHFKGEQSIPGLRKFFVKLKQDIKAQKKQHVILMSGGDDLEGAHRESTLLSIDKMPTGQAILYQAILLEELEAISKLVKKLDVYFLTSSNHTEWRIQGAAGEFPADDALVLIAEYIKLGVKPNKKITFRAQPWFRNENIGGVTMSFAHGNKAIHKNLYKWKALCDESTILLRNHTHHTDFIQEPTFDNVVGPSTKLHVEDYEAGGGWADKSKKNTSTKPTRTGQFIEIIPNTKTGRVQELRMINI